MDIARTAAARIRAIATRRPARSDLAAMADHATSMADAHTALCIAHGVPFDDITGTGYSLTREAYEAARQSWRNAFKDGGGLTEFTRPWHEEAIAHWTAQRPQLIEGDDWFADTRTDTMIGA